MTGAAPVGCRAAAAGPYPLTHLQESRILRAGQAVAAGLPPRSDLTTSALEAIGELDLPALREATRWVSARHPALRTAFGADRQWVAPCTAAGAGMALVVDEPGADRPAGPVRFDLGEPVRASLRLSRLGPGRHRLTAHVDHLVSDDQSVRIIWRDLWRAYADQLTGTGGERAGGCVCAPHAFRDYAIRESAPADPHPPLPEGLAAASAAMRSRDSPFGFVELPLEYPLHDVRSRRPVHGRAAVDDGLWAALTRYGEARRCSPYMLLVAAVVVVLRRRTGTSLPMLYTTVLNRTGPEQDAVGWFASHALLAGRLPTGQTLSDVVRMGRAWVFGALRDGAAATRRLHRAHAGTPRRPANLPSLSVAMVDMRDRVLGSPPGLRLRQPPPAGAGSLPRGRVAVLLSVGPTDRVVTVSCEEGRFATGMPEQLAGSVVAVLRSMVKDDSTHVDSS